MKEINSKKLFDEFNISNYQDLETVKETLDPMIETLSEVELKTIDSIDDNILKENIARLNLIFDICMTRIKANKKVSGALITAVAKLSDSIVSAYNAYQTSNFQLESLNLRQETLELKKEEIKLKLKDNNGKLNNNLIIIDNREKIIQMIRELDDKDVNVEDVIETDHLITD